MARPHVFLSVVWLVVAVGSVVALGSVVVDPLLSVTLIAALVVGVTGVATAYLFFNRLVTGLSPDAYLEQPTSARLLLCLVVSLLLLSALAVIVGGVPTEAPLLEFGGRPTVVVLVLAVTVSLALLIGLS